jgi:hypothetical protein
VPQGAARVKAVECQRFFNLSLREPEFGKSLYNRRILRRDRLQTPRVLLILDLRFAGEGDTGLSERAPEAGRRVMENTVRGWWNKNQIK